MEASERSRRVLAALVREYIASGEPVASSLLVTARQGSASRPRPCATSWRGSRTRDTFSSRTPRPGAIPTDRGYRFYVDLLLESKRSQRAASAVEARLRRDRSRRWSTLCALAGLARRVPGVAPRRLRAAAGARSRRVRSRRVRAAAARRVCWWSSSPRGGHVVQKVIDIGEALGGRRSAPGGELLESRVLRAAAAPRPRSRAANAWTKSGCCTTR